MQYVLVMKPVTTILGVPSERVSASTVDVRLSRNKVLLDI
ncbi:hypothetical protein D187_009649 [Cystobacter fuscus DSM 2262]|uniref:Uncharacterized protein n=1 Tax=Cystobacter fuscus (strain ATCC 25194 / DSM 2262 / NBRC 100088 / M29) TaxID=1242864 RepID=S9QFM7_CYSF2|nr:hypothetical protein D187_009649 [Cystobacter fuscus DSM 2262]